VSQICFFNVPIAPAVTAAPIAWGPIQGSLGQVRATQDALAQFLEQLFQDLEQGERNEAVGEELLRRQIEELAADRTSLERELDSARDEITKLSGTAVELASARVELADARAKAGRLRDQLVAAAGAEQQLRDANHEAELERRSLESELDILRRRAAELSEDLAAQKRQSAQERTAWNAELKQWRLLFEKQAALLTASHSAPAAMATAKRAGRSAGPADPVLGSVLAQFEGLHKDPGDGSAKP
jgi:chromosome segregation ATPase